MRRFLFICFLALTLTGSSLAGDLPVTAGAYYDTATGHKYIQNEDQTYSEYSQRADTLEDLLELALNHSWQILVNLCYEKLSQTTLNYHELFSIFKPIIKWRYSCESF